jgi:hypothetical protein
MLATNSTFLKPGHERLLLGWVGCSAAASIDNGFGGVHVDDRVANLMRKLDGLVLPSCSLLMLFLEVQGEVETKRGDRES